MAAPWTPGAYAVADAQIEQVPDIFLADVLNHSPDSRQGYLLWVREEHVPTHQLHHLINCFS